MTLNEALQIFGLSIIMAITKMENHEMIGLLVNNSIIEEWFDGDLAAELAPQINALTIKYGSNTVRQAARVIADTVRIYGDVS